MPIDFRKVTINFDPSAGLVHNETATAIFGSNVLRAETSINGFDVKFSNGDHALSRLMVDSIVDKIQNNTVKVRCKYLLRDATGNIDDVYQGKVEVFVLAEVA